MRVDGVVSVFPAGARLQTAVFLYGHRCGQSQEPGLTYVSVCGKNIGPGIAAVILRSSGHRYGRSQEPGLMTVEVHKI